jgi:hypothetical protein
MQVCVGSMRVNKTHCSIGTIRSVLLQAVHLRSHSHHPALASWRGCLAFCKVQQQDHCKGNLQQGCVSRQKGQLCSRRACAHVNKAGEKAAAGAHMKAIRGVGICSFSAHLCSGCFHRVYGQHQLRRGPGRCRHGCGQRSLTESPSCN